MDAYKTVCVWTTVFFLVHSQKIACNTHSLCGFTALFIMVIHLYWAIMSFKNKGEMEKTFHRFSPYAWLVWIFTFSTGIP